MATEFISGADICGADVEVGGDFDDIDVTDFTGVSPTALPAEGITFQFEGDFGDTDGSDGYCWGLIYLYAEGIPDGGGGYDWLEATEFKYALNWNKFGAGLEVGATVIIALL